MPRNRANFCLSFPTLGSQVDEDGDCDDAGAATRKRQRAGMMEQESEPGGKWKPNFCMTFESIKASQDSMGECGEEKDEHGKDGCDKEPMGAESQETYVSQVAYKENERGKADCNKGANVAYSQETYVSQASCKPPDKAVKKKVVRLERTPHWQTQGLDMTLCGSSQDDDSQDDSDEEDMAKSSRDAIKSSIAANSKKKVVRLERTPHWQTQGLDMALCTYGKESQDSVDDPATIDDQDSRHDHLQSEKAVRKPKEDKEGRKQAVRLTRTPHWQTQGLDMTLGQNSRSSFCSQTSQTTVESGRENNAHETCKPSIREPSLRVNSPPLSPEKNSDQGDDDDDDDDASSIDLLNSPRSCSDGGSDRDRHGIGGKDSSFSPDSPRVTNNQASKKPNPARSMPSRSFPNHPSSDSDDSDSSFDILRDPDDELETGTAVCNKSKVGTTKKKQKRKTNEDNSARQGHITSFFRPKPKRLCGSPVF